MSVGNFPFRDPQVESVLNRLHKQAAADKWKIARRVPLLAWAVARQRLYDRRFEYSFFHDLYIPVSREQGAMLYLLARAIGARRIVEFGSSFGISTIYLAAAARETGGEVFGSELEPSKHAEATKNISEANLSKYANVLLGDAHETFRSIPAPIDLVLLDGWKAMYISVLEVLKPKLRNGAVVLADNIFTFKKVLRPFVDYMQSGENGFVSTTLQISDGFEFSLFTADNRASGKSRESPALLAASK
jgi:predicted O-methyltransferase YrrM